MLAARDPHLDPPPFRGRTEKPSSSWVLDALCRTTGWHRKHAVRALRRRVLDKAVETQPPRKRKRRYGAAIKDALTALWEASDRVCGKRLVVMIPILLSALVRHGRLELGEGEWAVLLTVSAATIDRMLGDVKFAAAGGRRRRVGFYSAIRREVPIRTFNDWKDPAPGFCEVDMVAHGGTSVAGSFIQTLTMVDVAAGWTECRRWSIAMAASSLRRSSAPRACSPGEACCRPPAKRKAQMMDDAFQPCCSARPQWDNLVTEPLGEILRRQCGTSHKYRRVFIWRRIGLPAHGRSATCLTYRLWIWREATRHNGHTAINASDRTAKIIESAESLTLSTTNPLGTREEIRKSVRMALIPQLENRKVANEIHRM